MKATELIAILQRAVEEHGDRDVLCTWESITPEIASIYIARTGSIWGLSGELLIDCDGGAYQRDFAETVIWERDDG